MRAITYIMMAAIAFAVSSCGETKHKTYVGPDVTQIYVSKQARKLYLLNGKDVISSYDVSLGFTPNGDKLSYGDGKTPEGFYRIDRRNPNSRYHLALGISYPNTADVEASKAAGVNPGGDIFIHGATSQRLMGKDWTAGCIAVSDKEIEEIYAMVQTGTPIYIAP